MKVEIAIAHEVKRQGVRDFFCLQSEETLRMILELTDLEVNRYDTRHEAAAVGMADGYSRATGSVGVAVVSRGPGVTNGLTAMVTASKGGSSIIVFTGATAVGNLGAFGTTSARVPPGKPVNKNLAQAALLDDVGIRNVTLRSPESAVADVAAAFALVRTGVTVVVNMPIDVLESKAGDAPAVLDLTAPPVKTPDPADIAAVADLLETGFAVKRPIILVGNGAIRAGAIPEVLELADRIGALLVTSLKARSLFAGEKYNLGISGTYCTPLATELITSADLVLVIGASLNGHTTFDNSLYKNARVVQVDRDAGAFGRYAKTDLNLHADAKLGAAALVEELDRRGHRAVGYRTPDVTARIASSPDQLGNAPDESWTDKSVPGCLDPRTLMKRLNDVLPKERTIVQDSGHNQRFSTAYLTVPDLSSYVRPSDSGAVGSAAYVALGVAVGRPDRLTVLCIGDGGFMFTLTDFDTAVRYGLHLLFLVSNNNGFGAEVLWLRDYGLPDHISYYKNPPLEAVAKGFGAEAMTISALEDIDKVEGMLQRVKGPMLIDCKVSLEIPFPS